MRIAMDRVSVRHIGEEGEPVVVIDSATGIADDLVDYAATRSRFLPAADVGSHYPGLLGPTPTVYVDALVRNLLPVIGARFGTGALRPVRARGNFSLVTTEPSALSPEQRVPHVDAADRLQFAAVHYLCGEGQDGTGFFRHLATGFETIDAVRLPAYIAARDAEAEVEDGRNGYPGQDDDPAFTAIASCRAVRDRIVLYRAALLHSGLIARRPAFAADPRRGRLTGNLFVQCAVAA